jgi:hypothetical protein
VVVIACEPMEVSEMGLGLSAPVQRSLERAVDLVAETASELLSDAAYEKATESSSDA